MAKLADLTTEPPQMGRCTQHVEAILHRSKIILGSRAVDTESILILMWRNLVGFAVGISSSAQRSTVAVLGTIQIYMTALYIIRYRNGIGADTLIPCYVLLITIEQIAEFSFFVRIVGNPVLIETLTALFHRNDVEGVGHGERTWFVTYQRSECTTELAAAVVSSYDVSSVQTACNGTS